MNIDGASLQKLRVIIIIISNTRRMPPPWFSQQTLEKNLEQHRQTPSAASTSSTSSASGVYMYRLSDRPLVLNGTCNMPSIPLPASSHIVSEVYKVDEINALKYQVQSSKQSDGSTVKTWTYILI